MYLYTPDEIDKKRAHHQADIQGSDDVDVKRIGNLGELAFEQFCREYLPVELWAWENEEAIRRCNAESFSGHDFELFGYTVDVKTSRDVSAFRPTTLLANDDADDIIVMVWHRDNEDGLILLGWERTETLQSKVTSQETYSGEEPAKLSHLAARPMNELHELGPNTAHMNQKPQNPYAPGDRVVKANDDDASVAVVVEVLPPEKDVSLYGQSVSGEAVRVAFPNMLDEGPGDWRTIHAAKLASYCADQEIKLYTYKHTNLAYAENPYVLGDYVFKTEYDDPDTAIVVSVSEDTEAERNVDVVFRKHIDRNTDDSEYIPPNELSTMCEDLKQYSYTHDALSFADVTS